MKNRKRDLAVNIILLGVMAFLLIITINYAWITDNKSASANGITATTINKKLDIVKQGVYIQRYGEEAPQEPYLNYEENNEAVGILYGDLVYYSVSLTSKDLILKDINIMLTNIDGGEYFTEPFKEITKAQYDSLIVEKHSTYQLDGVSYDTYLDEEGKEYFLVSDTDVYQQHYIYETIDESGNKVRFNMCDVYTIKLYKVHGKNDGEDYQELVSQESDPITFVKENGLNKTINRMSLYDYSNWNPNEYEEITFTFKIIFDYTAFSGLINTNSVSNKEFIFNNVLISSTNVEETE